MTRIEGNPASDAYWALPFSAFASKFATTWLVESGPLEGALFGFKESSLGALKEIGVPGLLDKNCKGNERIRLELGLGQAGMFIDSPKKRQTRGQ